MRILHAVHNFPPEFRGGTEAYVEALAREQAGAGHEPVVVAGSEIAGPGKAEERNEPAGGCRVIRLRHDPATERYGVRHEFPRLAGEIVQVIDDVKPDVVHVHHWFHLAAPIVGLAKERGIPAVVSLHDYFAICPRFFLLRPDGYFCGDHVPVPRERCRDCVRGEMGIDEAALEADFEARRAFFVRELTLAKSRLAPSRVAAEMFAKSGILGPLPPIDVLPLGLLEPFAADAIAPRASDANGKLRLVFFGNVATAKGIDDLLAALDGMTDEERAKTRLTILGRATDDALEARIAAAAPRIELVREAGYDRARLTRLPAEADVAVFPSRAAETYSLVVDEALALGLPLVVSDRGAMAERAGGAATVFRAGDVEALRATLRSLLDPLAVAELRSKTESSVFTIKDHAARLAQIYGTVAATSGRCP